MGGIYEAISLDIDKWKSKGLTPSSVKVGPDVEKELMDAYNILPATISGVCVVRHNEPGFFCTGPWFAQPPIKEPKK